MATSTSKTDELRQTVAFGVLYQIDIRLRKKIPFAKFKKQLEGAIAAEDLPPVGDKVIGYLYERVIDAKVNLDGVKLLRRIGRSDKWKSHRSAIDKSIKLAAQIGESTRGIDLKFLPSEVTRVVASAARSSQRLSRALIEIQRWNDRMDQIAGQNNRNAELNFVRYRMNRTLERHCPALTQDQRVELIRCAVEAGKLKPEETVDAILKVLQRRKKKPGVTSHS